MSAASSAVAQTSTVDLERELIALHAQSHIPGLCVAVFNADGVLYEKGLGFADLATRRPYTVQTTQPIGSISKTLIGAALMKGVERGWFTLDQDIDDILPFAVRNPNFPDKPITLRQLATHTSGLVDRQAVYAKAYVKGEDNVLRIADFLKAYVTPGGKTYDRRNFAKTAPGTAYAYSNIGATLAAYAIEVRAGESYAEFTRKTFLEPLGMSRSGWTVRTSGPDRATLYDEKLRALPAYTLSTYPDGGLRTSCDDLAKYFVAILKARAGGVGPLSRTSVEIMLKPEFTPESKPANVSEKEPNQGIFWQYRREGTVGHFGGDPGLTTFMGVDPASGVGKIMLTNVGGDAAVKAYGAELGALWKALLAYQPSPPAR